VRTRFRFARRKTVAITALAAIVASVAALGVSAIADDRDGRSEHWGVITRNTIGSPVADLRSGPYGSFGVNGPAASPPYGEGSLGIEVADRATSRVPPSEKVDFGNEVDFFGDSVLGLTELGFHVFQTGENVTFGGGRNMPNIRFEIDPNEADNPSNYTTMVWVPDPAPVTNQWSGFIDATTTGNWYFTGTTAGTTGCTDALNCDFTQAKAALNDGGARPVIFTAAVGKGRDNLWAGAVDGLRINRKVYDFEDDGVRTRESGRGRHHDHDDDDD
jgi:hypothetical protein